MFNKNNYKMLDAIERRKLRLNSNTLNDIIQSLRGVRIDDRNDFMLNRSHTADKLHHLGDIIDSMPESDIKTMLTIATKDLYESMCDDSENLIETYRNVNYIAKGGYVKD